MMIFGSVPEELTGVECWMEVSMWKSAGVKGVAVEQGFGVGGKVGGCEVGGVEVKKMAGREMN